MATRKTTTTKTTTGTTGGKTTTKTTKTTKATKAPNALSTTKANDSTEAITTAIKQVQKSLMSLQEEVETIKASIIGSSSSATGITQERMNTLVDVINQFSVWTDSRRADHALNKWKNNKI